jgi:hypothetical protein
MLRHPPETDEGIKRNCASPEALASTISTWFYSHMALWHLQNIFIKIKK